MSADWLTMLAELAPTLFILGAILGVFYGYLVRAFDAMALRFVLKRIGVTEYSVSEIGSVVNLVVATVAQLACVVIAGFLVGWEVTVPIIGDHDPALSLLGIPLGIGELGVVAFISYSFIRIGAAIGPRSLRERLNGWEAITRGGWIRFFLDTRRLLHPLIAHGLIVVYIATEEIMFRSIVLGAIAARPGVPESMAILLSTIIFMFCQISGMPSRLHAAFPVIGAAIVGPIHALIALQTDGILPLIIAHYAFFELSISRPASDNGGVPARGELNL